MKMSEETILEMNKSLKGHIDSVPVQRILSILCAILALGILFVLAYHNKDWKHVWLAAGMNNDEVIYNRQLVGVLASGQPKGVFGYNESGAQIGHFGTWGPVLIYLYALPAALVGIGVNTVFWSNVILFLIGWSLFIWIAKVSWKKQLALGLVFACSWLPLEQVFSGSSEPVQYTLLFVLLGTCFAMREKISPLLFWLCVVACSLTTITRGYTLVLWLFPLTLLWRKDRKYFFCGIVAAGISLLAFLVCRVYFSAPYYDGMGMDTQGVQLLLEGKAGKAVLYELDRLREGITFLYQSTALTLSGQTQEQGKAILIFGVLFLIMVFCLVYDLLHKRQILFKALTLFSIVLILSAIFLVYSVGVIQRHLVMLCVWMLCVLIEEDSGAVVATIPLCAVFLPMNLAAANLPSYYAEMDQQMQQVESALQQCVQENPGNTPWDFTLAYAWGDGVFHGYLYAVPAGMGIQFDQSEYLADDTNPIRARYAMVGHDTETEDRLLADGWQELVSTTDLIVYERSETVQ